MLCASSASAHLDLVLKFSMGFPLLVNVLEIREMWGCFSLEWSGKQSPEQELGTGGMCCPGEHKEGDSASCRTSLTWGLQGKKIS